MQNMPLLSEGRGKVAHHKQRVLKISLLFQCVINYHPSVTVPRVSHPGLCILPSSSFSNGKTRGYRGRPHVSGQLKSFYYTKLLHYFYTRSCSQPKCHWGGGGEQWKATKGPSKSLGTLGCFLLKSDISSVKGPKILFIGIHRNYGSVKWHRKDKRVYVIQHFRLNLLLNLFWFSPQIMLANWIGHRTRGKTLGQFMAPI